MVISIHHIDAGKYWTDSGAIFGVLPYAIWGKTVHTDELHRRMLALNLLLIRLPQRIILVDTGLGNRLSEKQISIYNPSLFMLPVSLAALGIRDIDVTDVVLTHLHFDHCGGLITNFGDSERLTFPRAKYWIQKSEWEIAKNPDDLNKASYNFNHQLYLLEQSHQYELIEGNLEIAEGVTLIKTGGHTAGSQIVEIETSSKFYIYPADIIPTFFHISLAVTSAYDLSRTDTYTAKQYIYSRLKEKKGSLLLNHDPQRWEVNFSEIKYCK